MFLMAFHQPVCGWLGVIHLDEAGKELQGVGAEISDSWRVGEGSSYAGRRLEDADRGKPSAELVGIGHGVWRMWVGKGMAMALSGGGPATP